MLLSFLICLLVFCGIAVGLAWPLVTCLALDPAEKLTAAAVLSLLGVFLLGWLGYVLALPVGLLRILPLAALAGLFAGRRSLSRALRDHDAATLAIGQLIITLWSIGGLGLVLGYSGGGWVADWWGHMQRTYFFLDRGRSDILFNGFDALTSRPPLANVVTGAFLEITQRDFAHYQFFSTILGSLVFLPAGLLARRFGGSRAIAALTVLVMVNPMYAENVTYAWTKLPAAFFILAALYFFLRAHDKDTPPVNAGLFAVALSAGLLTHYSAGPYAVSLGLAWLTFGWPLRRDPAWRRNTAAAVLAGALVLAVWFGWALAVYGWHGTFLTNTSITDQAPNISTQLQVVVLNIRDTLVPHFFRQPDYTSVTQNSSAGWWRDWFFNLYQLNFFFVFGSIVWAAITFLLIKQWRNTPPRRRVFWALFIMGNSILGMAVHGARDTWGLAHICLQPLVLLGLAYLAARWLNLGRPWRLILIAGATVDFALGILLQFGMEANVLDRWSSQRRSAFAIVADYSRAAEMNLYAKAQNHLLFVGDILLPYATVTVGLLAALLLIALIRTQTGPSGSINKDPPV